MEKTHWTPKRIAKEVLVLAVMFLLIYFGNQQIQTWLGKRAIEATALSKINFEAALQQAKLENKPILAEFSAIWCPGCRKLDSRVLAKDEVRDRISEDYVFVRLEYESADRVLFKRYGVSGFPTLLVLNPDGGVQRQLSLSYNPEQFATQL